MHELLVNVGEGGGRGRNAVEKVSADIIRNWLPDGPAANLLEVIEHIFEHAMTLRAKVWPVLRIQADSVTGLRREASHTLLFG